MHCRPHPSSALAVAGICLLLAATLSAQTPPQPASGTVSNELDAFMAKVLARREVNRKTLEQYVLDETESFEILGPGREPLHRSRREFTWYVRDGMHVRSPVRFNGVAVAEEARERYEANWMRRERERQERQATKEQDGVQIGSAVVPTEPRFVSEAYFLDFKFDPGNYYLVGKEPVDGQDVLRIEYYPTRMFKDNDDDGRQKEPDASARERRDEGRNRQQQREREIERQLNKTALVTLWVDPKEHQIVKYTFENVWLDFLPAAWLVRVDDIRASMTMGQPFAGVWLPRTIDIHAGVTLANGSFEAAAGRRFTEYRLAEVETKLRIPKRSRREHPTFPVSRPPLAPPSTRVPETLLDAANDVGSGPFVPEATGQTPEIIGEIRIHGNAFLTDTEVLDLAGIAVGQPLDADGVERITRRLKDSDRFETVQVRKRYRSLTSSSDVALVLVVHEKPGVGSAAPDAGPDRVEGAIRRRAGWLRSRVMFLPIVSFADGYGFTYGGRVSTVDALGAGERLSVPLTWGGTRRAALEVERLFETGPLTRIDSSVAIWSRENPRFDIRDTRLEIKGRAERVFADLLRAGVEASQSTISFGVLDDRLWTLGTTLTFDTRLDPAFPGHAVLLTAGWTGLHFRETPGRIDRYLADARGYLRVFRQIVLAGRTQYVGADAPLPAYERLLLGGSTSVRGFRTGSFDGDRSLVTSLEVRVPVTSVLNGAKLGVTAFVDAGKVWDVGQSAGDAEWRRGVGGGLFLIASVLRINVDIARGLETGQTRVHLSSGFSF